MGFVNSFKDEVKFLFSGKGMPYEKVCLTVAVIVCVLLSVLMGQNFAKDAPVIVIDLDNSRLSREITTQIDSSEYMRVTAVVNVPSDPQKYFFRDETVAVVYFPQDFEKNFYTNNATPLGIFYDNSNTAQTADVKEAMNELVAINNALKNSSATGGLTLNDRNLFNPAGSTSNTQTQGFLFFFGSMFFVFATIGMVPRLRLTHQLDKILLDGTPWDLVGRILPYAACMIISFFVGLAILRVWGDLVFNSGRFVDFLLIQVVYAVMLGMMSVLIGWTASNPGIASSRMILFIPGGFILGGVTSPLSHLSPWVVAVSHIFPLTWEFHFTRDIIQRGATLSQISSEIGAFFIYVAIVAILLSLRFHTQRNDLIKARQAETLEKISPPEELTTESTIRNILVPTDGSGQAFKALLQAISISEAWGARITLMMVVEIDEDIAAFEQVSLSGYIPGELNATAYNLLNELRQVVPSDIETKIRVEVGNPADEIVSAANDGDYDLVVMGNRGFGGFDTESVGSVAKFVQENCSKPVVLAKGMPDDWDDENNFTGGPNTWK